MKSYPQLMYGDYKQIEMIPVDFVSKAIVTISLQSSAYGKTYNVVNPSTHCTVFSSRREVINIQSDLILYRDPEESNAQKNFSNSEEKNLDPTSANHFYTQMIFKISDVINVYEKEFNYSFKRIPITEWVELIKNDDKNPLFPLLANFQNPPYYSFYTKPSRHTNLLNGINSFSVHCHPPNFDLLVKYIQFYQEQQWIPLPDPK